MLRVDEGGGVLDRDGGAILFFLLVARGASKDRVRCRGLTVNFSWIFSVVVGNFIGGADSCFLIG